MKTGVDESRRRRAWMATAVAAVLALGLGASGQAAELNHYFAGMPNADDYFLPPEDAGRLVYAQYFTWYRTDTFRNASGDKVRSVTVEGPLGQPRTAALDLDLDNFYVTPAILWAPKQKLLGARFGGFVAIPVGNPSLAASLTTEIGRGLQIDESSWGLGDIDVQPLWFMWSRPQLDVTAVYGFFAPTGKFEPGAADNVGFGFWEHYLGSAVRYHLDAAKTFSAVLNGTFEIPMDKEGADITPGTHFSMNWGLRKNFLDDWLQIALLGYDVWQTTDDRGADVTPAIPVNDEVHAAGVQIGVPRFGLTLKYYHEYQAEDRFEGQALTLFFALPLEILAEKVGL